MFAMSDRGENRTSYKDCHCVLWLIKSTIENLKYCPTNERTRGRLSLSVVVDEKYNRKPQILSNQWENTRLSCSHVKTHLLIRDWISFCIRNSYSSKDQFSKRRNNVSTVQGPDRAFILDGMILCLELTNIVRLCLELANIVRSFLLC